MSITQKIGLQIIITVIGFVLGLQVKANYIRHEAGLKLGTPYTYEFFLPEDSLFTPPAYLLHFPNEVAVANQYLAFTSLLFFLLSFGVYLFKTRDKDPAVYGDARWGTLKELSEAGYLSGEGIILGRAEDGRLVTDNSDGHCFLSAISRSGKGVSVVVPTLLSYPSTVICYDLKGENYRLTSGFRSLFSHVLYLDLYNHQSVRYNPLDNIRKGDNELRDVNNLLFDLTSSKEEDSRKENPHFLDNARNFLRAAHLHVLYAEPDKSLPGVADFLYSSTLTDTQILRRMLNTCHLKDGPHREVAGIARSMLSMHPEERSGVFSTAKRFMSIYRDPVIAMNMRISDFLIEDLYDAKNPCSLYLALGPSDIDVLAPTFRLIINQILRRLTEDHEISQNRREILLELDEMPQLEKQPFIERGLGYYAGYKIRLLGIGQSDGQFIRFYGQRHTLKDNAATQMFYAPNSQEEAERISKMLGTKTVNVKSQSVSSSQGGKSKGESKSVYSRPLLYPDEVRRLGKEKAIIISTNQRPFLINKLYYYKDPAFMKRVYPPAPLSERRPYPYAPPKRRHVPWHDIPPIPPDIDPSLTTSYEAEIMSDDAEFDALGEES